MCAVENSACLPSAVDGGDNVDDGLGDDQNDDAEGPAEYTCQCEDNFRENAGQCVSGRQLSFLKHKYVNEQ